MKHFDGIPNGNVHLTPIPIVFFNELLPEIEHLGELKLTIYVFWLLDHLKGGFRYLTRNDFLMDENFLSGFGENYTQALTILDESLELAITRGTLLKTKISIEGKEQVVFFLNSPKGRAAVKAIESGEWAPSRDNIQPEIIPAEFPNIFQLFEENIGPLTPMIADTLGEAEKTYPIHWIEDAIRIAVEKNKRNWRYIQAILDRWHREGRDDRKEKFKDRQDSAKDYRRFVEDKFSDFIDY